MSNQVVAVGSAENCCAGLASAPLEEEQAAELAKDRTFCINEMRALLVTAPSRLRERLPAGRAAALAAACARLETAEDLSDPLAGTAAALGHLAARYHALDVEIGDLDRRLARLVKQARPDLLSLKGVGTEIAAQLLITCGDNSDRLTSEAAFASLCEVSPVPASSGKTQRHRLNRGGDRQANRALYLIALSRSVHDPRTRAYLQRRISQGRTKREIPRCLKRYIARELYKMLTRPQTPTATTNDLPTAA